jgi:hypothetical protein
VGLVAPRAGVRCGTLPAMSDPKRGTRTTHPDDAPILARWEQLGRPPIPVAFNERGLVWKTIVDLAIYFAIPQDAEERQRAVDWMLEQRA